MKVCWWEQGPIAAIKKTLPDEASAVVIQKAAAAQKNFEYQNDEAALIDFMTVNWAWLEE